MYYRLPCDDRPWSVVRKIPHAARRGAWMLAATILGSAMPGIDGTAVNVALPVLQRDLHASSDAIQWVVEGYSLFLSALILVGGSLGDLFGRKRLFLIGTIVFAAASAGCAVAQTMPQLIGARCIQGIGGALLVPESLALITASFDERERGAAIGTWSGFLSATMAIGPLLGGWLVQAVSWRFIFVINIPIAIAVITLTLLFVDESRDEESKQIDWLGGILATAALGLLTYGFIDLQGAHVGTQAAIALACGVGALVAFIFVEHRCPEPMIPPGIFASRNFTVANLYTLLLYAALGAGLFFIPFNLINIQHYTPFQAGAALLPMIVLMFLSSRWAGGLVARIGARIPLTVGAVVSGAGFLMCGLVGIGGSYWSTFFPAIVTLGIGTSMFVAPLTTTVMNSAPAEHAGSASGINNATSRVAALLAIAVLGIVLVNSTQQALRTTGASLPPSVRSVLQRDSLLSGRAPADIPRAIQPAAQNAVARAYVVGFRNALELCALLCWISAIMAGTLLTKAPRESESRSLAAAPG